MKRPISLAMLLLAAGCETGIQGGAQAPGVVAGEEPSGADASLPPGGGAMPPGGRGGGSVGPGNGLPCEVNALLVSRCQVCHGAPPAGAPQPLVTWANLVAPSASDSSKSNAEVALARMEDSARPMPPGPGLTVPAPEVDSFRAWVLAGMPRTGCGGPDAGGPVDAGAPDDLIAAADLVSPIRDAAAVDLRARDAAPADARIQDAAVADARPPNLAPPPNSCSSGTYWKGGDQGSQSMHPGVACIDCHRSHGGAPKFTIAGTVYLLANEPNDCNGLGGNAVQVVITDNGGKTLTLTPNSAGNFYSQAAVALPFHAKLVSGNKVRAMASAQSSGDCNLCHTQAGSGGAPGRVMAP